MAKGEAKNNNRKRLVVLDSHAIIHRAYHALPDFANTKGEPTGALYGLSTMLMKIVADLKPDYIVAAYDLPGKTFRHEAYGAYKEGRAKADTDLVAQLKSSRKIFQAFGVPIYDMAGFEADDIIGTISEYFKKDKNIQVIIASGDMDTMQLIDGDRVQVFTLKKGLNDTILYDEKAVIARFGFKPTLLTDYKGLRGDPSDNIIGIKGIGEKTATTLITNFGTIEEIYKKLKIKNYELQMEEKGITKRIIQLLKDNEEEALFSKTLATIRRDAPIDFHLPPKEFREGIEIERIENLFRELEFKSLTARARTLFNKEESIGENSGDKEKTEEKNNLEVNDPEEFKKLAIALWLLNSEITTPTLEDIKNYTGSSDISVMREGLMSALSENNLFYVYEKIEIPIMPVIEDMERCGVKIDVDYIEKLGKKYHAELSKLEKSIWGTAGREFNINSPKQLGEVLFDEMKIDQIGGTSASKRMKKTASGARSTRESELEKLRNLSPIIDEIFKYRELQKLLSTYIDVIPALVGPDGRIHAKFNQAGSTTGRFSSSDPNMQNIPIKTELGKNIRTGFVAEKGYKLVSFDYSQIELRIAALLSQDQFMIDTFTSGKDIHSAVAMKVFNVKESEVTHEMRRQAKVINFGILYGMGVSALQQNLGNTRKEAQEFYDNYFAQFPTIANYLESVKDFAYKHGYTETLFGRRRYFPMLKSKLPFLRASAERQAINAPIQGTATADLIKLTMANVFQKLKQENLLDSVRLVLQVHDELVYEIREDKTDKIIPIIEEKMQNVIPPEFLKDKKAVPIEVHVAVGDNWGELK